MAHVASARNGLSVGAMQGARTAYEMHSPTADEVRQSGETWPAHTRLTYLESAGCTNFLGSIQYALSKYLGSSSPSHTIEKQRCGSDTTTSHGTGQWQRCQSQRRGHTGEHVPSGETRP